MHGPDGSERPEERTDPLLPMITEAILASFGTPTVPRLDDRALAELLAELDGDDVGPAEQAPATAGADTSVPTGDSSAGDVPAGEPRPPAGAVEEVPDAAAPRSAAAERSAAAGRYVRRDRPPPTAPAEVPSLTGLTRRSLGRIGSIAFTVVFVAIFLLILVQAVASVFASM